MRGRFRRAPRVRFAAADGGMPVGGYAEAGDHRGEPGELILTLAAEGAPRTWARLHDLSEAERVWKVYASRHQFGPEAMLADSGLITIDLKPVARVGYEGRVSIER